MRRNPVSSSGSRTPSPIRRMSPRTRRQPWSSTSRRERPMSFLAATSAHPRTWRSWWPGRARSTSVISTSCVNATMRASTAPPRCPMLSGRQGVTAMDRLTAEGQRMLCGGGRPILDRGRAGADRGPVAPGTPVPAAAVTCCGGGWAARCRSMPSPSTRVTTCGSRRLRLPVTRPPCCMRLSTRVQRFWVGPGPGRSASPESRHRSDRHGAPARPPAGPMITSTEALRLRAKTPVQSAIGWYGPPGPTASSPFGVSRSLYCRAPLRVTRPSGRCCSAVLPGVVTAPSLVRQARPPACAGHGTGGSA
jgi:hypothetical protein